MTAQNHFIQKQEQSIHCISVNHQENTVPLIIIPGAINCAEEILEDLQDKLPLYHIIVSLRGRGQSTAPQSGYSLDDHASDVVAVIQHFKLTACYLFGHSIGATVGIRVAKQQRNIVKGLILGDYPPFFPPFDNNWVEHILQMPNINISKTALYGMANEGTYTDASNDFKEIDCPILLVKGEQKDSLFPQEYIPRLQQIIPQLNINTLPNSGHDIFNPSPDDLLAVIQNFLAN